MRKKIYSDVWGEIVEYTKYRGRKGRFVSYKYGRRNRDKPGITEETEQWKIVEGKRTERISYTSPKKVIKTGYPGLFADTDGNIYDALRITNILSQIHTAREAIINIKGITEDGKTIRLQSSIKVGQRNQDEQLAIGVRELIREEGYRTDFNFDQYELKVIREKEGNKGVRQAISADRLFDIQISVTLRS